MKNGRAKKVSGSKNGKSKTGLSREIIMKNKTRASDFEGKETII